jgi:ABC-type dipeptide/oligopeptide/nickel transport system permease component/ABC-type transport system substrate-binding protein
MKSLIRNTAAFLLVAVGFGLVIWVAARMVRGRVEEAPTPFDGKLVAEAEALRDVRFDKDRSKLPTPYKDYSAKDYEELKAKGLKESPLLAELVKRRKELGPTFGLPPVEERLPKEPVVMEGPEGIGNYGGTWLRLGNNEGDITGTMTWRMAGAFLCRWSPLGHPVKPWIAKSVEANEDFSVWTIKLREGLKWSNGDEYTTDDIMYWWNDEVRNPVLQNLKKGEEPIYPAWLLVDGEPPTLKQLSKYELTVTFPGPFPLFKEQLCTHQGGNMVGAPSKYIRRYHPDPKIGDKKTIDEDLKGYKQPSARALYAFMGGYQNTARPRLTPWIYMSYRSRPPQVFVRNPYFFAVDTEGHQLPYIDRVQMEIKENQQIMTISVANGDSTMQDRNVDFSGYTELMSRRNVARGGEGTRVLHWYPATRQIWVINVNNNRKVDAADPSSGNKEKLLSDKRFRQAMSVAINRQQIIHAEYYGVGQPSQVSPGEMSPFENADLAKKYTEHNPAQANKLLDDLGLTKRDYEGFRTFADGSRMTFFIDYSPFTGEGPMQFVLDDWKAVGVRVMRRQVSRPLFTSYGNSGEFDFNVWTSESDMVPLPNPWPSYFVASHSLFAPEWSRWFDQGGFYGKKRGEIAGADPRKSANGKEMYRAMELYEKAMHSPLLEDQKKLFREIQEIAAENVWSIGITTAPPALAVVDKHLKNVPERALVGATFSNPVNTGIEAYFFDNASPNPSADADLIESLIHPRNRPGSAVAAGAGPSFLSRLIKYSFMGIVVLLVVLVCLRHPFILRRLVILIPTLIIISIIVFSIVQLPPGDFLTNRRAQLEAEASPNLEQQLADLTKQFHTDEPLWKNYLRWVGLKWFTSFTPSDEGLLQGNLGRGMESGLPVNDVVGDRITLTFFLSLGTVLFTWALALPIGIYSAVRQYTKTDYVLTLLGFVGMSVPAFLLALVLMAVSGFTGLFSPEYATQPGWSWGKFMDLMMHLWIPILVLAVGGTAGMIRIMRANLLDELKKPYVTTARAKGVRPLKLLVKYPVRIALNPFVSGIGHLFPALVSGGSIVAIVLSLPMVGPVLLNSLFAQDAYLAGSMLMVLSVLGVLGTLVSDLLLLWLDPRIRFEGGSR